MACAFVGLKVVGGAKPVALPDVGPDVEIKITNAALEGKGKAELFVHRGEDEKYLACVLDESKGVFQAHLEYVFSSEDPVPVTFSVNGKGATVHITGFGFEQPGDDYSYDEDDESMFDEGSEDDSEDDDEDDESESEEEGKVIGIREITSDEEKAAKQPQKKAIPQKADDSKNKPKQQEAAAEEGEVKCVPCQKAFPNVRALEQHNIGKHKDKAQSKSEARLAPAKPAEAKPEAKPEGNGKKAEKQEKTPDTPKKPEQKKPQPQTPQPAKAQPKSTPAPKAEEKKVEEKKIDDKKRKASASQGQLAKKAKSN